MMGGKNSIVATFVDDGTDKSGSVTENCTTCYNIESVNDLAKNQPKSLMNDYHAILW